MTKTSHHLRDGMFGSTADAWEWKLQNNAAVGKGGKQKWARGDRSRRMTTKSQITKAGCNNKKRFYDLMRTTH
jgi:hypothetical protein